MGAPGAGRPFLSLGSTSMNAPATLRRNPGRGWHLVDLWRRGNHTESALVGAVRALRNGVTMGACGYERRTPRTVPS